MIAPFYPSIFLIGKTTLGPIFCNDKTFDLHNIQQCKKLVDILKYLYRCNQKYVDRMKKEKYVVDNALVWRYYLKEVVHERRF